MLGRMTGRSHVAVVKAIEQVRAERKGMGEMNKLHKLPTLYLISKEG
jgi:hypothetical protein